MPRRKVEPLRYPESWTISHELTANGRRIVPRTELKIAGERGRFRFLKYVLVEREDGSRTEWIDVWGGPKGSPSLRSFRPDRIRRVHRLKNTPEGLLEARQNERSSS